MGTLSTTAMRLLFVTIAIFCVAVSLGSNQDSWDDDTDVSPVPDQLGGSHKARTISKSGLRDKFLLKKLNEVRSKCSTPLPPITDFKVGEVTKQIVEGTEYHAEVTVDGVQKVVSFIKLLPNEQKPHHFFKKSGAGSVRDLFTLTYIVPHPCGEDTAELTDDSYETDAELDAKYKSGLILPEEPLEYETRLVSEEEMAALPTDFDWREKIKQDYGQDAKAATVLNQGSCGSCWAFGAATAAGYRSIIESKGQYNVVPSTQVGMSCAKPVSQGKNPCGGGWFSNFYNAMKDYDVPANWAVPYTAKGGQCKVSHDSIAVKGGTSRGIKGVDAMMQELYKNGPYGLAVDAGPSCFKRYKSGVADCAGSKLTHAVVAVGWGVEGGKPYWLVQNSWGAGWGANGFIKIARGKNALFIEQAGAQPNYISEESMDCKSSPPCKNGGAFRKGCTCKCLSGYSGAQCDSCQKSCSGSQFTGTAAITAGKCACKCNAGFVSPANLLGYSDCALKMKVGGSTSAMVKASGKTVSVEFSVVGSAPSDSIQNVKKGDMFVAVPAGSKPWTASGGWTTDIKADVCGPKSWPAQACGSSTADLSFSKDGVYDIFFVKYLGKSEFGTDKGYGSDFMPLPQRVCVGSADCNAAPPPPPPPPSPSTPPPPPPSPPAPRPPPPPSPSAGCKDQMSSCSSWARRYNCNRKYSINRKTQYLYEVCTKSCNKCGGGGGGGNKPAPAPSCQDKFSQCSSTYSRFCNMASIKKFCCATCSGKLIEATSNIEDSWTEN